MIELIPIEVICTELVEVNGVSGPNEIDSSVGKICNGDFRPQIQTISTGDLQSPLKLKISNNMKKSIQQMQHILEEIRNIKTDLIPQEPIKEIWIGGIEVQSKLFISERTLYRHRKSGRLPYSKVRGKIYYKKTDIRELLEKNYRTEIPKCTCCCNK